MNRHADDDAMQGDDSPPSQSAWEVNEVTPSIFITFWPDQHPPTQTEVLSRLAEAAPGESEVMGDVPDAEGDGIEWMCVMAPGDDVAPIVVWVEPAQPLENFEEETAACGFVIGVETILNPSEPVEAFTRLLRMLALAFPEAPLILDVVSTRVFPETTLREMFVDVDVDPGCECVFAVHTVLAAEDGVPPGYGDEEPDPEALVWIHTHGLQRFFKPDIEMIDVPWRLVEAATALIDTICEHMLESSSIPEPGSAFEISDNDEVVLQPWQLVAEQLPADAPASLSMRQQADEQVYAEPDSSPVGDEDGPPPHGGVRAIICEPLDKRVADEQPAQWNAPLDLLNSISEGTCPLYRNSMAAERAARLARATWPEFAMAFADARRMFGDAMDSLDTAPVRFLVKAGFAVEDDSRSEARMEHLWMEAIRFENDVAVCRVLEQPQLTSELNKDDVVPIQRDQISDWSVMTPLGVFEPRYRTAISEVLRAIQHVFNNRKHE
ncbi:MAG: DUF2314 domain-containing protein [Phycisphaerales bacterium]